LPISSLFILSIPPTRTPNLPPVLEEQLCSHLIIFPFSPFTSLFLVLTALMKFEVSRRGRVIFGFLVSVPWRFSPPTCSLSASQFGGSFDGFTHSTFSCLGPWTQFFFVGARNSTNQATFLPSPSLLVYFTPDFHPAFPSAFATIERGPGLGFCFFPEIFPPPP